MREGERGGAGSSSEERINSGTSDTLCIWYLVEYRSIHED